MLDIIYSILCHEYPESFPDTIKNFIHFNKYHSIKIIVNPNIFMHDTLAKLYENNPTIIFHPNPWNKVKYTYDVLEGHIQNFEYCKENNIIGKYFITLSPNCMFHKEVILSEIDSGILLSPDITDISEKIQHSGWNWPGFYRNNEIVNILNNSGIYNFKGSQHEGFVIEYNIFNKITEFIRNHKIKEKISDNTTFEEILTQTLYIHFTNKKPYYICKIFWDLPNYMPSIDDIIKTDAPCVKRVSFSSNDPVRQWILSL